MRLRLLTFFSSGSCSGSWFFPKRLRLRLPVFFRAAPAFQLVMLNCKKYKTSKIIVSFNHKNLLFFLKKSTISLCFLSYIRAEEPANFLAAPAPDFFSKRLRLWLTVSRDRDRFFLNSYLFFAFTNCRLYYIPYVHLIPLPSPLPVPLFEC